MMKRAAVRLYRANRGSHHGHWAQAESTMQLGVKRWPAPPQLRTQLRHGVYCQAPINPRGELQLSTSWGCEVLCVDAICWNPGSSINFAAWDTVYLLEIVVLSCSCSTGPFRSVMQCDCNLVKRLALINGSSTVDHQLPATGLFLLASATLF